MEAGGTITGPCRFRCAGVDPDVCVRVCRCRCVPV